MVGNSKRNAYQVDRGPKRAWWLFVGSEEPEPVEQCGLDECAVEGMPPTSFFCTSHQRFLPLVAEWSNRARVIGVIITSIMIWGGYVLSAEISSSVPVWLVHLILGLALLVLPLRHFPVSRWVAGLAWILLCSAAMLFRYTETRTHAIAGTVLLLILAAALAVHAAHWSAIDATRDDIGGAFGAVSVCLVVAAFAVGAAGLALVLPYPWLDAGRETALAGVLVAVMVLVAGLALAIGISFVAGWGAFARLTPVASQVASIGWEPQRATAPDWRPPTRPNLQAYGLGMVREIVERVVNRLHIGVRMTAEFLANLLFWAIYKFKRGIKRVLNGLKALVVRIGRVIEHTLRLAAASLRSFVTIIRIAIVLAVRCCAETIVLVGVPLVFLTGGAGLATAAAEETRRYLTGGALAALGELSAFDALGIVLVTGAWMSLAGLPRLRESLKSAMESATITGSYALLLIAIGGWLIGLPGTLGYGVIHVGWVTVASTVVLVATFLLPQRRPSTPRDAKAVGV
jgi:hypothetical protein